MKKTGKRFLAAVMTVIMILTTIPFAGLTAFAEDEVNYYSLFNSYIENNITLCNTEDFPNCYGVFTYLLKDFDKDSVPELVTFSFDYNLSNRMLVLRLYECKNGKVVLSDISDEYYFNTSGGNSDINACGILDNNTIKIISYRSSNGGSFVDSEYRAFRIANDSIHCDKFYSDSYYRGTIRREEKISGRVYGSDSSFNTAVKNDGLDHFCPVGRTLEQMENGNYGESHFFSLYNSNYLSFPTFLYVNRLDTVFNEKSYIADIWLNQNGKTDTKESKLVNQLINSESISGSMIEDAGKGLDVAEYLWDGMALTFNTGSAIKKEMLGKKEMYEALIVSLLKKSVEQDESYQKDVVVDAMETVSNPGKAITKVKSVIKSLNGLVNNPENALLKIAENWEKSSDDKNFSDFYNSIKTNVEFNKTISEKTFAKSIGNIAKAAGSVADFYEKLADYLIILNTSSEMMEYLDVLQKNAFDPVFSDAIGNIKLKLNSIDYGALALTVKPITDAGFEILGEIYKEMSKSNVEYDILRLIYTSEKGYMDFFYNTSGIINQYKNLEITNNFINANKKAVKALASDYISKNNELTAGAYVFAVRNYHNVQEIDMESALKFAKAAEEEGIANKYYNLCCSAFSYVTGIEWKNDYQVMLESKENLEESLNQLYHSLDNSWRFNETYLKKDYPDVYPIYLAEELSNDIYTPIIDNVAYQANGTSVITWSVPNIFYDDTDKCYYPLNSQLIDGITLKEITDGDVSEFSQSIEKAQNPLSICNVSSYYIFPKYYSLSAYSSDDTGRIYTKSSNSEVTNPIKTPVLKISNISRKKAPVTGNTIYIYDSTSYEYKDMTYDIYSKTDKTEWKLIATVNRDYDAVGRMTGFTDSGAEKDTYYSYKVVSHYKFTSGKVLNSNESAVLKLKCGDLLQNLNAEIITHDDIYLNNDEMIINTSSVCSVLLANDGADFITKSDEKAKANLNKDGVKITWSKFDGAQKYEIYRLSSYGSLYKLVGTVEANEMTFFDNTVEKGVTYNYIVIPVTESNGVKSYDTGAYAKGEVKYFSGKVESVSLGNDLELKYKDSAKLNPKIEADSGVKYKVSYKSSDSSIASVDDNGNVYGAKKWGKKTATITCTVTDEFGNSVSDTANVTVGFAWWQWIIGTILFGFIWY